MSEVESSALSTPLPQDQGRGELYRLQPALQHYAWGDTEFIPQLLGLKTHQDHPVAELWMGTHPDGPCRLGDSRLTLAQLIAGAAKEILGPAVAAAFQGELPYLFKVLAAAAPLSVQVHPSKAQAEAGFDRENAARIPLDAPGRNYRDRNHKPELICALTDFYALQGFRPWPDIVHQIASVPELGEATGGLAPGVPAWKEVYQGLMELPQERVDDVLSRLVQRLSRIHARQPFQRTDREYWLLRADQAYSVGGRRDRGLFAFYLLNLVHLRPGEALFSPPAVLHSYLEGAGMEIMANSNNVLRGGLTPKHVDVPELLRNVVFASTEPARIAPQPIAGGREWAYPTPAAEFELRRIELTSAARHHTGPDHSADVLIVLSVTPGGRVMVETPAAQDEMGQGQVFLVPHGVSYTLQTTGQATLYKATVPLRLQTPAPTVSGQEPLSFRGQQPTALAFGTSGLRGLVTDITDLEAYINTRGFLRYLEEAGELKPGETVCVAGDLRPSTDSPDRSILRAVAQAIVDAGLNVDYLGKLPTPALTHYALIRACPSIMVTGSHIPFDRNGIKFNKRSGEVLKVDEPGILQGVAWARRTEYGCPPSASLFEDDGSFKISRARPLPPASSQAQTEYLNRYLEFFGEGALQGWRVVFYQHSAVGRDLLVELLRRLGAEVVPLGRSETFVPIDTEAITEERLNVLQTLADKARAEGGRVDAVLSTDGDSDRPLLAGVDDQGRVRFFGGDLLGIVVADFLKADAVVVPVSANDAVDLWSAAQKVTLVKTRIGSPYVIEGMESARKQGAQRVVGWEANGGFLTGCDLRRGGRVLRALPTRDAALPLVAALVSAQQQHVSLVELFNRLPRRFSKAGLIDEFPPETSRALLRAFSSDDPGVAQVEFEADGVRLVAPDGTVARAGGEVAARWLGIRRELADYFLPTEGFEEVIRLVTIDGLRIFFRNGDIAHLRPSGNAPQLRIYAVAGSQQRAEEIVARALAEPWGILRRMESGVRQRAAANAFVERVKRNITLTRYLFERGETPEIIGTVSGSPSAQSFWQEMLDQAREAFQARAALSFQEDLPTNQAFGILLLWQRLRRHLLQDRGALVAFVFGDGTRSTPFTETDNGQKPAMATFVPRGVGRDAPFISMVELALRYFVPVQQHLRRSGFHGLVVKWGDEVQIPTHDLSGRDSLFQDADVVRFVSVREITEDGARNKDWVGVDRQGHVTAFIPRRPLSAMHELADCGWVQRRDGRLYGGVNLGSIGMSGAFLDALLAEFGPEVNDPTADRKERPALDPEFFTALTIAAMDHPGARAQAWAQARNDCPDVEALARRFPDVLERLQRAIRSLEIAERRPFKMVALDFGDPYWGDIGQHSKIYEFYMALNSPGAEGDIARAIAGLPGQRDPHGNLLVNTELANGVRVRNSVLINVAISGRGSVEDSVLIGTRAKNLRAQGAFDVLSTVVDLEIGVRGGTYKVVSQAPVSVGAGERVTTLFLPDSGPHLFRVKEETDLRDKPRTYSVPILGNPISFQQAHREMSSVSVTALAAARRAEERNVLAAMQATA